jgi:hypothetical protein
MSQAVVPRRAFSPLTLTAAGDVSDCGTLDITS